MSKRCRHSAGWYTSAAVVMVGGGDCHVTIRDVGSWRGRPKVTLRCNLSECDMVRHAYFDGTGRLVTVGRPYRGKP